MLIFVRGQIGFVGGEMKNPKRDIPRVINGAMTVVVCGFALINVAFYIVLPMSIVREDNKVAVVSFSPAF